MALTQRKAQWSLACVWFTAFVILAIVLVLQVTISPMYEGRSKELWDWFLPATTPTLGLMIATFIGSSRAADRLPVNTGVFLLALVLSIGYLLVLGFLIALVAIKYSWAPISDSAPLLAAVQGFVTLSIGAFFVRAKTS